MVHNPYWRLFIMENIVILIPFKARNRVIQPICLCLLFLSIFAWMCSPHYLIPFLLHHCSKNKWKVKKIKKQVKSHRKRKLAQVCPPTPSIWLQSSSQKDLLLGSPVVKRVFAHSGSHRLAKPATWNDGLKGSTTMNQSLGFALGTLCYMV